VSRRRWRTVAALVAVVIAALLVAGCLNFDDSQPVLADQEEASPPEKAVRDFFLAMDTKGMSPEDAGIDRTGYDLYKTIADPGYLPLDDPEKMRQLQEEWDKTSGEGSWIVKGQQIETELVEMTDTTAIVDIVGGLVQYAGDPAILGTSEIKVDNFKEKPARVYLRLAEADQLGERRWVIVSGGGDGDIWPFTERP